MINVEAVDKWYNEGATHALKHVTIKINEGELFGLIGPDGAGKTTLFQILTTLRRADIGRASVAGYDTDKDYRRIRGIIGYMPGRFSLYQDLTVEENLTFFASIFKTSLASSQYLIYDIYAQLEPFRKRLAGQLSGGMKQKLALCCALIHKPRVLFLDEPTTGVDAVSRREFWGMLKRLNKQGITIMVSTAYMDEAVLCDRISLIQSGELLSTDSPQRIVNSYQAPLFSVKSQNIRKLLKDIPAYSGVKNSYPSGETLHVILNSTDEESPLKEFLEAKGHQVEMHRISATVEDCFIELMKS
jgi:ABC-2 type transport system ATP-binding protein